jgi:hypothetical protein
MNEYILVKLTDRGKEIVRQDCKEFQELINTNGGKLTIPEPPCLSSKDFSRWQAWDLMETFGHHMAIGTEPPFELNVLIELQDEQPVVDNGI